MQEGIGRYQLTEHNGLRCGAALAYLQLASQRPNLTVISGGLATRILFDKKRAVGVGIARDAGPEEVIAGREVLLAAGEYGSPQLLLLSGIGPVDDLKMLRIEVRENLPVGHNLQDHPVTGITLFTALKPENIDLLQKRPGISAPDVQYYFVPAMPYDGGLSAPFDHAFTIGNCLLKPTSKGKVSPPSARPDAKRRILHNFATEEDRQSIIQGIRTSMKMARKAPLRDVTRKPPLMPASDRDAAIWQQLKRVVQTCYHPTSKCAIGSVVDPELRVFGMDGLRLVDASVMPSVIRGNTNAPLIMIAEKTSDMLRRSVHKGACSRVAASYQRGQT